MSDPKWMQDLDMLTYRATEPAKIAALWAYWAIARLPAKLRLAAIAAWKKGRLPGEANLEEVVEEPK